MNTPHHHYTPAPVDPRDDANPDLDAINAASSFEMFVVLAAPVPLENGVDYVSDLASSLSRTGVTVRGSYDVGGFRADADLMFWLLADSPEKLQAAYHAIRSSQLGLITEPVWSAVGVHRPAEFNRSHTPGAISGIAPRPWLCVYPFVRSYDWYQLDDKHRSTMLREHGMAVTAWPDVKGSTFSSFGLSDYEWLLAFEADDLTRIVDAMRAARGVEARLHVREETPFFTGQRIELSEWVSRQPMTAPAGGCCQG